MATQSFSQTLTFVANENLPIHVRVKLVDENRVGIAGADDVAIGVTQAPSNIGDTVPVRSLKSAGIHFQLVDASAEIVATMKLQAADGGLLAPKTSGIAVAQLVEIVEASDDGTATASVIYF